MVGNVMSSMYIPLSEVESNRACEVVDSKNKNLFLQPHDKIKVNLNDGIFIIFRKLGSDERYSVPWNVAKEIIVRKV